MWLVRLNVGRYAGSDDLTGMNSACPRVPAVTSTSVTSGQNKIPKKKHSETGLPKLSCPKKTRPGLVALYDIQPGNGAGPFLQPRSPHGATDTVKLCQVELRHYKPGISEQSLHAVYTEYIDVFHPAVIRGQQHVSRCNVDKVADVNLSLNTARL